MKRPHWREGAPFTERGPREDRKARGYHFKQRKDGCVHSRLFEQFPCIFSLKPVQVVGTVLHCCGLPICKEADFLMAREAFPALWEDGAEPHIMHPMRPCRPEAVALGEDHVCSDPLFLSQHARSVLPPRVGTQSDVVAPRSSVGNQLHHLEEQREHQHSSSAHQQEEHREKKRAANRRYRAQLTPEQREKQKAYQKTYRTTHPGKATLTQLQREQQREANRRSYAKRKAMKLEPRKRELTQEQVAKRRIYKRTWYAQHKDKELTQEQRGRRKGAQRKYLSHLTEQQQEQRRAARRCSSAKHAEERRQNQRENDEQQCSAARRSQALLAPIEQEERICMQEVSMTNRSRFSLQVVLTKKTTLQITHFPATISLSEKVQDLKILSQELRAPTGVQQYSETIRGQEPDGENREEDHFKRLFATEFLNYAEQMGAVAMCLLMNDRKSIIFISAHPEATSRHREEILVALQHAYPGLDRAAGE